MSPKELGGEDVQNERRRGTRGGNLQSMEEKGEILTFRIPPLQALPDVTQSTIQHPLGVVLSGVGWTQIAPT